MTIKEYREFVLIADDADKDVAGLRQFTVQVFSTPGAGEGPKEPRELSPELARDLSRQLYRLEHRKLDVQEIISLGEALADLLLPTESRGFLTRSLDNLERGQGLRVRLRLHPLLADIPWEYMYVQRGEGEKDETGFLALDPRISLVRHEALGMSGDLDSTPRTRRVVAAMACPEEAGYDPLNLAQEQANLEEALSGLPNLKLTTVPDATIQALSDALAEGADIFHFAGHGLFKQTGQGDSFRSILGEGELAFVTEEGAAASIPAAQLAVNLQGHGLQLAVLGACQTGRRDGHNVWSGTVAALMEAGVPAVVAMQYEIRDDAAIAFSKKFYQVLVTGAPIDAAVSAGRVAAFNVCHPRREPATHGKFWRDWGVPVLYLRSEQGVVLPAVEGGQEREDIAGQVQADVAIARGEGAQAASGGSVVSHEISAPVATKGSIAAGRNVVLAEGGSEGQIGDGRTQIGGSIRAGQIQARNVVSGVQVVGAAAQPEVRDLQAQVAALREELAQAMGAGQFADEVDAGDADAALAAAEQELSSPEPRGERILRKLEEVKKVLAGSADAGVQLAKLAMAANTLWQVAQKLFGG